MSLKEAIGMLGEKTTRTDIWVVCIVVYFWLCVVGFVSCEYSWNTTMILGGMFLDLGVNVIKEMLRK